MSNTLVWPDIVDGLYIADPLLNQCGSSKTTYKQLDGDSFLFHNGAVWIGSTTICDESNSVKQLFGVGDTPPQVTTWNELDSAKSQWVTSTLTINSISCGERT